MTQKLYLQGSSYIDVDVMFEDFGSPARMGMVGGNLIEIAQARAPFPRICYTKGQGFFYMNREPLNKLEDIGPEPARPGNNGYLPEPYWSMAKTFIEEQAPKAKPLPMRKVKAEAAPAPGKRKPGRPARRPQVIDGPEAFERVAGVSETVAERQLGG